MNCDQIGAARVRGSMRGMRAVLFAAVVCLAAAADPRGLAADGQAPFTDVTAQSGLVFDHINGSTGELLLPEVIGSGGALFDYDNDGDLDLFAVQGSTLRPLAAGSTLRPPVAGAGIPPHSRLYRNDLGTPGTAGLRFADVTESSGLAFTAYGMGAATADFNNDGWVDLFVTALGANRLFRNNRDGTFTDITAGSGTTDGRWSTSATFFDYDRDGWLDLFVAHYVDFSPTMNRRCFAADSARDYCNPAVYSPVADRLFHNNRDGTFSDVSVRAGITNTAARGLGVLAADVNLDGWVDLYVANDGDPNQLWINRRNGTFSDDALLAGVALNRTGQAQGSMGIDAGDVDGDGDDDLFVTNLDNEGNTLYRNVGKVLFEDRSVESGVFKLGLTGFGTRLVDYDNDGWLDLVVVNGAVRRSRTQVQQGDAFPLRQRNQLFRNDRGRRFVDVTASAGPAFGGLQVGRGLAAGDLDNDGDSDLVIFNNSGPAKVLLNEVGQRQHWLGMRVVDGGRDALQARVAIVEEGGRTLGRHVHVDGSYCTASDPRVIVGLAGDAAPRTVRVRWTDGQVEEYRGLAADRYWTLERGKPARR